MIAVIAEKPGVAREIAALLEATEKKDGYLTGNGYCVTWAFGHLVGLGMPQDYGISVFEKTSLPILPDPFLLSVRKVKNDKGYTVDVGALKQLKVIEQVFNRSDKIIVATDAGREGELIFRYIYQYLKCSKPFERLWISSLTEKAIRHGLDNLKPGSEFEGLYRAAQGRSRADWLVGINASQALSIAAANRIYSLGRVQTPTLALICSRYIENKKFAVEKYWQLQLVHCKENIRFQSLSEIKYNDIQKSEEALQSVLRKGSATVVSADKKTVKEQPPLLFDLTGLQKEANKRLRFSAEQTLNIAQSLYEKKFITYPRTGSKYIPEDLWAEIPLLIRALGTRLSCKEAVNKTLWQRYNKHIVNDLKVTDHHGLLITDKIPSALSAEEDKIYDMIALRLLESVSQPCIKDITAVVLGVLHYNFGIRGSVIVEPGWRAITKTHGDSEDSESIQELPELKQGDSLEIDNGTAVEKQTKAPELYTEGSLLSAMETAGKKIDDADQRKVLQDIGIGTPATRAAIIETLFDRNYIRREKKYLMPLQKGLQVYEWIKDKKIADAAMTAEWELKLSKIERNELDSAVFQKEIEHYAGSIAKELLEMRVETELQRSLRCPKCKGQQLIIRDKIVKCPDEVCNWVQFRNICGVQLSVDNITSLINKGRTDLIKAMKSKAGKKFDAYIVLNDKAESAFEFEKRKGNKNTGK